MVTGRAGGLGAVVSAPRRCRLGRRTAVERSRGGGQRHTEVRGGGRQRWEFTPSVTSSCLLLESRRRTAESRRRTTCSGRRPAKVGFALPTPRIELLPPCVWHVRMVDDGGSLDGGVPVPGDDRTRFVCADSWLVHLQFLSRSKCPNLLTIAIKEAKVPNLLFGR